MLRLCFFIASSSEQHAEIGGEILEPAIAAGFFHRHRRGVFHEPLQIEEGCGGHAGLGAHDGYFPREILRPEIVIRASESGQSSIGEHELVMEEGIIGRVEHVDARSRLQQVFDAIFRGFIVDRSEGVGRKDDVTFTPRFVAVSIFPTRAGVEKV